MKISVIIRTYNEERRLENVLNSLFSQNFTNYEVIIVDSESTDRTLQIAQKFDCKIVKIKKKDFDYSYASNVGAKYASGDIVYFLSGHSKPIGKKFLCKIAKAFENEKVGGVYGETLPYFDSGFIEGIFYRAGFLKTFIFSRKHKSETNLHPGILSCSNAGIRKTLWEKHPFDSRFGSGGEDVYMAHQIIQEGYTIEKLKTLVVRHSHGKKIKEFKKELSNWSSMYDCVLSEIENEHVY